MDVKPEAPKLDRLVLHHDDIFDTGKPSGMDRVLLVSYVTEEVEARHTAEIRDNVARRKLQELGL